MRVVLIPWRVPMRGEITKQQKTTEDKTLNRDETRHFVTMEKTEKQYERKHISVIRSLTLFVYPTLEPLSS